jgi:hypothetical protein
MNDKLLIWALILVALYGAPQFALAEDLEGDRFSLSLGVFVTDRDTDTQLDGTTTGSDINFEKDLGLDSSDSVFRLDGSYRFNERHRLDFSVFDLSRSASRAIDRDIQWGDSLYTVNTVVDADVDLKIYKAAYTYAFMRRDKGYLGLTAGLYVADTRSSITEQSLGQATIGDITAPLPVIGLRGEYALSDRWSFRASSEFFALEYNDVDGSLIDLYAGIDYSVLDNISLGIGVNSVSIDVDASKTSFAGSIDWQYVGGLVFLKFNF